MEDLLSTQLYRYKTQNKHNYGIADYKLYMLTSQLER